jgi:hypothetical protein
MRPFRSCPLALACLCLVWTAVARADTPPDPLRLVPREADLFLEVKDPRHLLDTVRALPMLEEWYDLQPVREYRDSTNARLFRQLVAYFEKELGAKWPDLLDRLAGGGAVVALKFGRDPAPALLVIQGRDEELMHKFTRLGLGLAEQELARQGSKDRPEKGSYRDVETVRIGDKFHAAVVGSALLISNFEETLHHGMDLHLDGDKASMAGNPHVAEARKLLPGHPAGMAWLNLETVRQAPQAKDVFSLPRENFIFTVALGGLLDAAGRSPFLCAGLYADEHGFALCGRLPRGRDGMSPAVATHVPPAGEPGCRPLLRPAGVIFTDSYYLDVGKFWDERERLFTKERVKDFEDFDKNSGRFLAGNRFSKFLTQAGPYQRIVVAHQAKTGYKTRPKTTIPAFAVVVEMREPEEFAKGMETVLRGAALLAGAQAGLRLAEEKHGEHTLVGYRFPEDRPLKADVNDIRFNFSPCFCAVGNQFFASSTIELGHELIDLLEKEAKEGSDRGPTAAQQDRVFSAGAAELLQSFEDVLLTQAILDQALSPEAAREQVRTFIDLVRRLGVLEREISYGPNEVRYDVRLKLAR